MFSSKTQKQFKDGKKLVSQKKWNEALALFQALQDAKDIDQVELLSLINQAKDGLLNQKIEIAQEAIRRQNYMDALKLLQSLQKENPEHTQIAGLMTQTKEGIFNRQMSIAQDAIHKKEYHQATTIAQSLRQEYPDHPEIERLFSQIQDSSYQDQQKAEARKKLRNKVILIGGV